MKRMNHGSKGESIQLCVHVCFFVYVRSNIYILASHHYIAHTAPTPIGGFVRNLGPNGRTIYCSLTCLSGRNRDPDSRFEAK